VLALAEQDFLFPSAQPGSLRFKHGITREVVYGAVGLRLRRATHLRVAAALTIEAEASSQEESYESLAYHYDAGDQPSAAIKYYELAGDKAMTTLALDRARAQYSAGLRALDALGSLSPELKLRWCEVSAKLGMACVFDALSLASGVATFERAVALARQTGELDVIARAEYWLGYICYAKGMPDQAAAHCVESLAMASAIRNERLSAQVRATLGQVMVSSADYDDALPLLDDALSGKRRSAKVGSSMAVGSAYTLSCKGCLLGDRGEFALAQECFDEARALLGDSTHQVASSVAGWIAASYQWQGRWDEALGVSEASGKVAENVRSRQLYAMSRSLSGYARWVLSGDLDGVQALRDATSWIAKRNGRFITSLNYGWLVDCSAALDLHDEARRHAARLFNRARQRDWLGIGMGCRALARVANDAGEAARAVHLLAMADRYAQARASRRELAMNQLCRAQMALARGHRADADAPLDAASRAFDDMGMAWYRRQADRLRATA
jgi:tetratricopeptide (TPR) repeat protein